MDRWLYLKLHRLGLMGSLEKTVIEKFALPGMHAVDVGCNIGLYASHMSRAVGDQGMVTAFEPIMELHNAFSQTLQNGGIQNVRLLACALGSHSGLAQMCPNPLNSGDNQVTVTEIPSSEREVPLRRLDGLDLARPVDFLKIDVQGWEVEVLRGASGLMERQPLPILFCEVSEIMLKRAQSSSQELGQLILDYGYEIYLPSLQANGLSLEKFSIAQLEQLAGRKGYFDLVALAQRHASFLDLP